jgi:protein-tyrosine phosphatase
MGFAELHFHLLPGVDDGPSTVQESLALATAAVADGTELVVATPHIRSGQVHEPLELPERVAALREQLRHEGIALRVDVGGELDHALVASLSDTQLDVIAHGPAGARWLLLESPLAGRTAAFTDAADELRARGFKIVLAHPERSRPIPGSLESLRHELAAGTVPQINAWSIAGRYGDAVRTRAAALLAADPSAPIASDAHSAQRMPSLQLGLQALRDAGEPDPVARVGTNPWRLLRHGLPAAAHRRAA